MRTPDALGDGEAAGEMTVPVPGDGDAPATGEPESVGTSTGPAIGVGSDDGSGRRSPKYAMTTLKRT
jgi:hypothetical protein